MWNGKAGTLMAKATKKAQKATLAQVKLPAKGWAAAASRIPKVPVWK